jgi:hypothetical protein
MARLVNLQPLAPVQDVGPPAAPLIDAPHQLPPVHAAAGLADTGVPTTAELGYDGAATTTLKACFVLPAAEVVACVTTGTSTCC